MLMISYYLARPGSTQEGPFSEDELKGFYHQRTLPPRVLRLDRRMGSMASL